MATPWWLGNRSVSTGDNGSGNYEQQQYDARTGQPVYNVGGQYYSTTPRAESGSAYNSETYVPGSEGVKVADSGPLQTASFTPGQNAPYGNLGVQAGTVNGKPTYLVPAGDPSVMASRIAGDIGMYGGAQKAQWISPSGAKGEVVTGPDGNKYIAVPQDAQFQAPEDTANHQTMLQGAWKDFGPIITSVLGGMYGAGTFGGGADVGGGMASMAEQSAINSALTDAALGGGLEGVGAATGSGAISLPVSDPGIVESFPLSEYTAPDVGSSGLTGVSEAANNAAIDSSLGGGMEGSPSATEGDVLAQLPQRPNVTDPSDGLGPSPFKSNIPDKRLNPLDINRAVLQLAADSGIPAEIWQNLPAGISTAQMIAKLSPYFGDSSGPLSAYAKMLSEAKKPEIIDTTSSALGQMKSALTTDEGKYPSPIKPYLQPQTLSTGPLGQTPFMFQGIDPKLIAQMDRRGYAMGGPVNPVEYVAGPEDRYYARHQKRGFAVNGPGTGQSDDIPTMLADGEYVIDSDTVAALGDGSSKAGASVLDQFRQQIRQHKRSASVDDIPPKSKSPMTYLKEAQKGKKNG